MRVPDSAPPLPPLPYTTSPVRSTWVRDNDVDPAVDQRGTGYAPAAATELVEFVRARRVTEVYLAVPARATGGAATGAGPDGTDEAVGAWVARTCRLLRSRRTYVAALGGELTWLEAPELATAWTRDALAAAPFHRVHLDLAPWHHPDWDGEQSRVWAGYLAALDAVVIAARGVPLDVDVPWWFATTSAGGAPLLDAVLDRAARVTVLVDATRTEGPTGILERAVPAALLCDAREAGFSIGVTAGVPDDGTPGFDDDAALEREAATVRATLRGSKGYRGFAVQHYRTWRELLG